MVIYELFVRNFSEAGTFQAVEAGLDDIMALGADTLWLLPVHPSGRARSQGSHGSPFAVRDHMAVHPDQGTMEDFKCLVRACHDKGLRVVLDWVANHTAWDHPWIVAHPERYTRDRAGNITHPQEPLGRTWPTWITPTTTSGVSCRMRCGFGWRRLAWTGFAAITPKDSRRRFGQKPFPC